MDTASAAAANSATTTGNVLRHRHSTDSNVNEDDETTTCPICLDTIRDACETSCGHYFCSKCLMDYWNSLPRDSPKKCPLDRKIVTFVIPSHGIRQQIYNREATTTSTSPIPPTATMTTTRPTRARTSEEQIRIDRQLYMWNQILNTQSRPFFDFGENVHLLHRFYVGAPEDDALTRTVHRIILFTMVFLFVMYLLMPYDLIADNIPVIGYLDDFLFPLVTLLIIIPRIYRLYVTSRAYSETSSNNSGQETSFP